MSKTNHFPFPNINSGVDISKTLYPSTLTDDLEKFHYSRRLSKEVQLLKSQYFILEDKLVKTFDYVYPECSQINVYSPIYALIINGACNLFETVSRMIYKQIYTEEDINIFNYLSLDKYINFSKVELDCPRFEVELLPTVILKPFDEFDWSQEVPISTDQIPDWWKAYNKIKHDPSMFPSNATMGNAIRAIAATAILMYKVYGPGITIGNMYKTEIMPNGSKRYYALDLRKSQLFDSEDGRLSFEF